MGYLLTVAEYRLSVPIQQRFESKDKQTVLNGEMKKLVRCAPSISIPSLYPNTNWIPRREKGQSHRFQDHCSREALRKCLDHRSVALLLNVLEERFLRRVDATILQNDITCSNISCLAVVAKMIRRYATEEDERRKRLLEEECRSRIGGGMQKSDWKRNGEDKKGTKRKWQKWEDE